MAEVKVSALTALTGANVANGDELYIVDTGSPNVSKKITADELAQMPQLSSRYKPLASDTVWIPGVDLRPTLNTPSVGTLGNATFTVYRQDVLLFDHDTDENATLTTFVPPGWTTVNLYLWWSNAGAGAGGVAWRHNRLVLADAVTTDDGVASVTTVATAPAQYVAKRTTLASSVAVTANAPFRLVIGRNSQDAGDTLTNDAGVIGVEIVRAS